MTYRQRLQAILDGGVPDRVAWVPRLDIWYQAHRASGTLPPALRGLRLAEAEEWLGMGHSARKAVVYHLTCVGAEERTRREGSCLIHTFVTPRGEASCVWHHPAEAQQQGIAAILVEPYVRSARDYEVMQYVAEHLHFVPDYATYRVYDAEVGEKGYPLVVLGQSPIHLIMRHWLGYERFCYEMADAPGRVEALWEALEESYRAMWEVVARSPACLVLHGVHFCAALAPPPLFRRYFVPYFQAFNERMHRAGIRVAFHADADLTGLLELVLECGFDVADCLATHPLVRCTFEEARRSWGECIVIWEGVPSVILERSYDRVRFENYVLALLEQTTGRSHFILGVSDNIMPGAEFERLVWIRDILRTASPAAA